MRLSLGKRLIENEELRIALKVFPLGKSETIKLDQITVQFLRKMAVSYEVPHFSG